MPKTHLEINEIPDGSMGYGGTIESVMDHLVTSFDLLLLAYPENGICLIFTEKSDLYAVCYKRW